MFLLGAASPIDPAKQYAGAAAFSATEENLAQIRANWGVDDPLPVQYLRWVGNLLRGGLGWSTSRHEPVTAVLGARAGWTWLLVGAALAVVLVTSLLLGTLAAYRRGGAFDRGLRAVAYAVEAMPVFWIALAAIALFALTLGWLPAGGLTEVTATGTSAGDVAWHSVPPVAVLAVSQAPWFVLFVRDSVAESLRDDHVLAAKARGLPGRTVLFGHALRTALLPFLRLIGTHLPELVGGAVSRDLFRDAGRHVAGGPASPLSVGAGRHAHELREPRAEGAQRGAPHGEADVGHGQVRAAQQRHGALDPARHEVRVRRLPVREADCRLR
jgi:peptide/nickel transport system permease protein